MRITRVLLALSAAFAMPMPAQEAPLLAITRDLRIDPATADLAGSGTMLVSRSGEILVTQPDDATIRVFSPTGVQSRFGHKGEGPGEFRDLRMAGWLLDSIWVVDPALRRVSLFGPDHKFVRSFPYPSKVIAKAPIEGDAPEVTATFPSFIRPDGTLRVVIWLAPKSPRTGWATGADSAGVAVVRLRPDGVLMNRITFPPKANCEVLFSVGKVPVSRPIPFCAAPVVTMDDGTPTFVTITTDPSPAMSYRVTVIDDNGVVQYARTYPYTPVPLPRARFDSVDAAWKQKLKRFPGVAEAWPKVTAPKWYPAVRGLMVGRDSTLWIEVQRAVPGHAWLVLDAKGRSVGQVKVSENVDLKVADLHNIWGLETDADGLQGIVRYRITRSR